MRRVQWQIFQTRSMQAYDRYTSVHLFDPNQAEGSWGRMRTLCGKTFGSETAIKGDRAEGRNCAKCKKAAAA